MAAAGRRLRGAGEASEQLREGGRDHEGVMVQSLGAASRRRREVGRGFEGLLRACLM